MHRSTIALYALGVAGLLSLGTVAHAEPQVQRGVGPSMGPSVGPSGNVRVQVLNGQRQLAGGQPRRAMQSFQAALDQRPNHERALLGLLEAMAEAHICVGSDAAFQAIEGSVRSNAIANGARGACAEHLGELDAALAHYAEAIRQAPSEPRYRYARANLLSRMGRAEEAEAERVALFGAERGPGFAFLAEADDLWRQGDPGFLAALQQAGPFLFVEDVRRAQYVLEAKQTLEEECTEKPDMVLRLSLVNPELAARSSECRRRAGDLAGAAEVVDRGNMRVFRDSPAVASIIARILVDSGEVEEAERMMAGQPDALAPVLASRWYLARARADEEGMRVWSERYGAHPAHRGEPLDALLPLGG